MSTEWAHYALTWKPSRFAPLNCLLHEIRNQFAAIKGNLQLLNRATLPVEAGVTVMRLTRISESLERLTRQDNGLGPGVLDGPQASEDVLSCVERYIGEHYPESVRVFRIVGSRDKVRAIGGDVLDAVFRNLLRNAMEAGSSRILVAAIRGNGFTRIRVADNGNGCPPEALPHLFDPFFTLKAREGGSGLGLHIVKSLLESNGGGISAALRIKAGRVGGMVFTLHLPLAEEPI